MIFCNLSKVFLFSIKFMRKKADIICVTPKKKSKQKAFKIQRVSLLFSSSDSSISSSSKPRHKICSPVLPVFSISHNHHNTSCSTSPYFVTQSELSIVAQNRSLLNVFLLEYSSLLILRISTTLMKPI